MPKPPKTVLDKVVCCIRALKEHGGSSRQTIHKYLKREYELESAVLIKQALKRGVAKGALLQSGQRFSVPGESYEQPAELRVAWEQRAEGSGPACAAGDRVLVSYVGSLEDGTEFDSGKSFGFCLGDGEVIKGWEIGVTGMRKGGTRELTIPPKLGCAPAEAWTSLRGRYGAKGSPPEIPPNATLHFSVTLKAIK